MKINVLTIFPGLFESFLNETLIKRAIESGKFEVNLIDIREHATDKHHTTDDTPYGGGPGMVMKVEPIFNALKKVEKGARKKITLLSPRGRQFSQSVVEEYAKLEELTLICGRYEGVDQRVVDNLVDEELSIGPYVMSGGEVPSMVVIEAVSRYLPGVLGNPDSLIEETNSLKVQGLARPNSQSDLGGLARNASLREDVAKRAGEYPQYTRPPEFNGWKVPEVLLSGNHEDIRKWRDSKVK